MDWIVARFLYMMHALGISFFSFWLKVNKVENGVAQINRLVLLSMTWLFLFFGPKRSSQFTMVHTLYSPSYNENNNHKACKRDIVFWRDIDEDMTSGRY